MKIRSPRTPHTLIKVGRRSLVHIARRLTSQGAFRISYDALDGRYLRQEGFLNLLQSGYIGAYAKTTNDLKKLVAATLRNDRAVVAAVQSALG
jgi:hypothetical protein